MNYGFSNAEPAYDPAAASAYRRSACAALRRSLLLAIDHARGQGDDVITTELLSILAQASRG